MFAIVFIKNNTSIDGVKDMHILQRSYEVVTHHLNNYIIF
jgi:hypothetical protein